MGFEKTIKYFSNNWSEHIENLFSQSLEFSDKKTYPALFQIFCEKKFKNGIIYILSSNDTITIQDVEILQKNMDEYTLKDILLTSLKLGPSHFSKILFILENLENDWTVEFIFYILNELHVSSLDVLNLKNFIKNVDNFLAKSSLDSRHKIIKEFEKNINLWRDNPYIWNTLLKYQEVYEIFLKTFFDDMQTVQKDKALLHMIDPDHYINIINFISKSHYIDKKLKKAFYEFILKTDVPAYLLSFVKFINQMSLDRIQNYAADFSFIPFFDIANKIEKFDGNLLLSYLVFIFSTNIDNNIKLKTMQLLLNSLKSVDFNYNSLNLVNLPPSFIKVLTELSITNDTGILFIVKLIEKIGDYELIKKLPHLYKDIKDELKFKINEIYLRYSLKSIILDEKKTVNMDLFVDILKKVPINLINDVVSLIFNVSSNIKIRIMKLVELLNYDTGVDKIIDELVYKDKDKKVRATCIRLIKLLKEEQALKHLRVLLFDEDPRVRANAVEIFELFLNADNWFVLLTLSNDPNNRVRGNVAKALFPYSSKHSIEMVKDMLNSNDELFVISALWVIDKLSITEEFFDLIASIEKKFPTQRVKNRIKKLLSNINVTK